MGKAFSPFLSPSWVLGGGGGVGKHSKRCSTQCEKGSVTIPSRRFFAKFVGHRFAVGGEDDCTLNDF